MGGREGDNHSAESRGTPSSVKSYDGSGRGLPCP